MTIRKQYPPRNYETFPENTPSESDRAVDDTPRSNQTDSDKSRSAASEAQRLASEVSWADTFVRGTPATNLTPTASTVDGSEVRNIQYPHISRDPDLLDPPPVYTPSDTTFPSPVVARSVAVSEPVSAFVAVPSSPSHPQYLYREDEDYEEEQEEDDSDDDGDDDGALLPEPVQHQPATRYQHHHQRATVPEGGGPAVPMRSARRSSSRRGCGGRRKRRGCGGRRHGRGCGKRSERARRFKRACFFIFALLLCLWLLIPGLLKALSHSAMGILGLHELTFQKQDGSLQFPSLPNFAHKPSPSPWPPEEREHRERETSRSIRGSYKLYDLLDLSTTSGSIAISVDVQPGEKPAVLRLASSSGSVNVRMTSQGGLFRKPTVSEAAEKRVLHTDISTQSGSVSGQLVHGNGGSTRIATQSASISLDIFTVGVSENDPPTNITTTSGSGSQNLRVIAPLGSTEPVRAIGASHTVLGSGSMSVRYPMEWEGTVHIAQEGSGTVTAGGHGLTVRKVNSQELYGYKGNKEGRNIEIFEQGSGSIRFQC